MSSSTDPVVVLKDRFGFDQFLDGQRDVVDRLLEGRSTAAVFPTGGGKSLCYQLPALMLDGLTLVVSPLIALMKDQIDALHARGIEAARLDSTLDADQYRDVMDGVRSGRIRMLYVAPERFNNERFRQTILPMDIALFAVDEAHCISEWGHNFRPDYLKLVGFAEQCGAGRVLALTATATPPVLEDICREFRIDDDCAIRTGFYRPNLTLLSTTVSSADRDRILVNRLRERPAGPTIVYVTLQKTAVEVADRLYREGFAARAYHAGMKSDERAQAQDAFMESDQSVVVATIAFGMGIDKSDIRYVYHYNPPKSLENYSQEIGRAGRDGELSVCEMLYCADDLSVLENFVYGDTPSASAVLSLMQDVFSQSDEFDVGHIEISNRHDIRVLVIRTLLTYLELDGYLQGGTPFYSSYKFQPKISSAEILSKFDPDRQQFLKVVLAQSRKAKTWFSIDVDQAARAAGSDRDRVIRALEYISDQGWIELQTAGVRHRYRILKRPDSVEALADDLYQRTLKREENEIGRLRQVVELLTAKECQVRRLCAHFGEDLGRDCGHCSTCVGDSIELAERAGPELSDTDWQAAVGIRRDHPDVLRDPRLLTRFLCGTTSPALVKAKLTKHEQFGRLSHVPFHVVFSKCSMDRV